MIRGVFSDHKIRRLKGFTQKVIGSYLEKLSLGNKIVKVEDKVTVKVTDAFENQESKNSST